MRNQKKTWITLGILLAAAAAVVLMVAGFELTSWEDGSLSTAKCLSDGFFTVSVLYIGCSILMYIQEAGNFYGIQFLFHTLVHLFSFRKDQEGSRQTYYAYCQDKIERQAAEGKSPVKILMLLTGLIFLALSVVFVMLFYRLN